MADTLDRCRRLHPLPLTDAGEQRAHPLVTAVSCQLLGEFAELCGPFANVLITIRDQLVTAIYSDYYEPGAFAAKHKEIQKQVVYSMVRVPIAVAFSMHRALKETFNGIAFSTILPKLASTLY